MLAVVALAGFAPQAPERVDMAAIARLRDEGLTRSQVMDTAFWLTDRYGPRLTGSPEFEEAGDWAIARLKEYRVADVRKERFASGQGWSLVSFHATMTAPRVMPIIGVPRAWTPGISGTVTADVVRPIIATEADAASYRGKLRGKIILAQSARPVRMNEFGDGTVLRYADQGNRWLTEAMTPDRPSTGLDRPATAASRPTSPPPSTATAATTPTPSASAPRPARFDVMAFYRNEGVLAIFDRGPTSDLASGGSNLSWIQQHPDGGTIFVDDSVSSDDVVGSLPQVRLAVEHYNRLARLVDHQVPVKVELNLQTRVREEVAGFPNSFNIVGEIPGTDKADELVVIGAHFDSWHGATGATDNAAGSAAAMEVMRMIRATGLQPRRTIRICLWGDEEGGLVGSEAYAARHLGALDSPTTQRAKTSVYFNLDNGTGRIRGVWTQGNEAARQIFSAWSQPLRDLGVEILSPRSVQATDHASFDALGVPAFQFLQERYEYNSRTHHSNMDFYDRLQPEDMKQMATVAAIFVWHAATRDDLIPRLSPTAGAR